MDYIKVKDSDHLLRDPISNGIVNSDVEAYNAYVQNYKKTFTQNKAIENIQDEVKTVKKDLEEIKNLLRSLINEP
jgi:formiminotetrahydrofolate cyclodeaminase